MVNVTSPRVNINSAARLLQVVVDVPFALPTVCVTVYVFGFGYVWVGFLAVEFGVLSPK